MVNRLALQRALEVGFVDKGIFHKDEQQFILAKLTADLVVRDGEFSQIAKLIIHRVLDIAHVISNNTSLPNSSNFWEYYKEIKSYATLKAALLRAAEEYNEEQLTLKVEVYWDPEGILKGYNGFWRVRMYSNHEIHAVGATKKEAKSLFLLTAQSFGFLGNEKGYNWISLKN